MPIVSRIFADFDFNVLAGDVTTISGYGTHLRIVESSQAFKIKVDHGSPVTVEKGMGLTFPETFEAIQIIAPDGASVSGRIIISDGVVFDNRVSISAEAGLSVNVIKVTGPELKVLNNTLDVSGGATPSRAIIAALNTNIEWVMVENRGASQLAISNAIGQTDAAILLDPGERVKLTTGGPMFITNLSAITVGAYSALYGERA